MVDYKDDDVSGWEEFCLLFKAVVLIVGFVGAMLWLCGCSALQPPAKYVPGENFGNGGETRCNTRQIVDGGVPWCPFPNDGDGFNQYQEVVK